MSKRQSLNKRYSRHGRSSNFSDIINPDSNIIDDDNPLWWKNLDGDSVMVRRSMRLSVANRASTSLDPDSRIDSFEYSKEWWKNLDNSDLVASKNRRSVSKSTKELSVQDKDATDNHEPTDVSDKDESIYKKKHALFASKKRKSHGMSNFLNVLNETSMTTTSEPLVTRNRKETISDNSYVSNNENTLNKHKSILRNYKRRSGHDAVNDTHKTMEDNSSNLSKKRVTDSSGESDYNDDHVIKSKRILRSTKHKETTGHVFDDLLLEDENMTPKRSIEDANESEESIERSVKKSRVNIFKKKRVSLPASKIQMAIEDDNMEESNRQNVTVKNDRASNSNNLSMNSRHMTRNLHSKINNSISTSLHSNTEKPETPSKVSKQSKISESLNNSETLNPSVILNQSPILDNLVSDIGSTSLIGRKLQNNTYEEHNFQLKDISEEVINEESIEESQNHSNSKNVNGLVRKINRNQVTTPRRQTRSSVTPHKERHTSHTDKKDFATGSDADNSSSESENPLIAKRKTLTAGKMTRSKASLSGINESDLSDVNQSRNDRYRMTRSQSKSNIQESPKPVAQHSHNSSLIFHNKSPDKAEEIMENVDNNKSANNSPVLLSYNNSISQKENSSTSKNLESPAAEHQEMHHSFENNQNSSQNLETPKKSQNKSLNRKSQRSINPSNISSSKQSITYDEDDAQNDDTKSDENHLPKSKPNFLRKLRKSLAADAFDSILASKSVNDSKTNVASDNIRTDVPRGNNTPVPITAERSDVDFCSNTFSTSILKMGPLSQSSPYSKNIVPSTLSTMHSSDKNVVNGTLQMEPSIPSQPELSNASQTTEVNNTISSALQSQTSKNTKNYEKIIDKDITDRPSASKNISNVGKKPTIISSIIPHLTVSRTTKKQTEPYKGIDQTSSQILQDKYKMTEVKKVLENIKKRELEKMDRYLTKIPADQFNKSTIPNRRVPQSKNQESNKTPKRVNKAYIVNGKVYKRAKLPRPKSWATNHLYEYLWKRLEPKYKLNTRVRSEKFMLQLANVVSLTIRRKKYKNYSNEVDALMNDMARLEIIKTRNDFYDFCYDFLPYEFRVKVTPILLPGNVMSIPYDPKLLHTPILNN